MNNNLIFKVKTIQSRVIKILIESLKDLLYEVNFIFSKEGISMNANNTSNFMQQQPFKGGMMNQSPQQPISMPNIGSYPS